MEQQQCKYADLKVSPSELAFQVNEGWKFIPASQPIFIEREGIGMSAPWQATGVAPFDNEDWVRLTGASGSGKGTIRVSCSSVGMPAGIYSALVEVESPADIQVIDPIVVITLTVHPVESPSPPTPPPDPDPEPEPEPEPPAPEPDPEPPPPPPPPDPEPPEKNWFIRLLEWLMDQLEKIWKK